MDILTLTLNPCVDRTLWSDGRMDMQSGGKGINVARVLSQLGADCTAVAPAGGKDGSVFEQLAVSEGVRLRIVPIKDNTRTVDTYVSAETYGQKVEVGKPPRMTEEELQALEETVTKLLPKTKAFCVCGSACCEAAARVGAGLIRKANAMGVNTLLDANGPMLLLGVEAHPQYIKPNQKELGQLMGRQVSAEEEEDAARTMLDRGIDRVILSMGAKGAALVQKQGTIYCPAPKIREINPVGSGDSFVAGYLYALLKGQSEFGALAYGCAAGAANAAMFPAARIGKDDIEKLTGYAL